jgi:hypothetical protein
MNPVGLYHTHTHTHKMHYPIIENKMMSGYDDGTCFGSVYSQESSVNSEMEASISFILRMHMLKVIS